MKKMKCAVYVRTNNEATNTKSIQYQIAVLENYINNHELELYKIYSDISDGSTLESKGIRELMEEAKEKKFDIILVKDFTRIARKFELIQQFNKFLESTNIKLITLDDVKTTASSTKGDAELLKLIVRPTKLRVAAYVRAEYGSQNTSIPAQIQLVKNYVNEHGWELYDIYTDEGSDNKSNRAGIQRLIKDAQENKYDVIVTKEFSRITRKDALLYELMITNHIQIITLSEPKIYNLN